MSIMSNRQWSILSSRLRQHAVKLGCQAAVADDIAQEVVCRLLERDLQLELEPLWRYARVAVHNLVADMARRSNVRSTSVSAIIASMESTWAAFSDALAPDRGALDQAEAVESDLLLGELDWRRAEVLRSLMVEDSLRSVAASLEIPNGTAMSRAYRARRDAIAVLDAYDMHPRPSARARLSA